MLSLPAHLSPIRGIAPDAEYLAKYIVKDTKGFDHWFWHDGRRNHRHNLAGFALVTWKVKPTVRTDYKKRGEYVVARVLLEQRLGALQPRLRIRSRCGLPQCINPDHWVVPIVGSPVQWRLAAYTTAPWQLLDSATGVEVATPLALRLALDGVVHVVRILPSFMRPEGAPLVALCGAMLEPARAAIVDVAVTCKGGC